MSAPKLLDTAIKAARIEALEDAQQVCRQWMGALYRIDAYPMYNDGREVGAKQCLKAIQKLIDKERGE